MNFADTSKVVSKLARKRVSLAAGKNRTARKYLIEPEESTYTSDLEDGRYVYL